jgi:hypothetical protein
MTRMTVAGLLMIGLDAPRDGRGHRLADHRVRQKNGGFKKVEELRETSRSGPCLLRILFPTGSPAVSRSQEVVAADFSPPVWTPVSPRTTP